MGDSSNNAREWDAAGTRARLKADIQGDVRGILASVLGTAVQEVAPDHDLEADLGLDSLKMIETNVALEARFGFVTPDVARPEELQIRTVDDLVGYVADQMLLQGRLPG